LVIKRRLRGGFDLVYELRIYVFSDELAMMFGVGVVNSVDFVVLLHGRNVYFIKLEGTNKNWLFINLI
jgi:hypothetical protein